LETPEAMLLAVDAGNTNIVFALLGQDGSIAARWRIATDARRTADEYAVWLHQLLALEGFDRGDVTGVIIGTVVPRALHNLQVLSRKYFGQEPLVAGQGEATWGIRLDVDEPHNVGADRVLNAIAAHASYPGDLVVIDFGTATTFDVVDYTGLQGRDHRTRHQPQASNAPGRRAPKLPRTRYEAPDDPTVIVPHLQQMLSRHLLGYVAMIEGLLAREKAEIVAPVTCLHRRPSPPSFSQQQHGLFDAWNPTSPFVVCAAVAADFQARLNEIPRAKRRSSPGRPLLKKTMD
jgi:type III pantothenate kinase